MFTRIPVPLDGTQLEHQSPHTRSRQGTPPRFCNIGAPPRD